MQSLLLVTSLLLVGTGFFLLHRIWVLKLGLEKMEWSICSEGTTHSQLPFLALGLQWRNWPTSRLRSLGSRWADWSTLRVQEEATVRATPGAACTGLQSRTLVAAWERECKSDRRSKGQGSWGRCLQSSTGSPGGHLGRARLRKQVLEVSSCVSACREGPGLSQEQPRNRTEQKQWVKKITI